MYIQEENSMKPIAHFENRYLVTFEGEIINLASNLPLQPIQNSNGYLKVGLADGKGGHIQKLIHRIVAKHYVPNPYDYTQVNHIDGDKSNNNATNLEWVTAEENVNHALKTGLRPGYMSASDKEIYLHRVLKGEEVKSIAATINRRPETLHKMLRTTASRLGMSKEWETIMKENRRVTAIQNLRT
jgi:hypothetical protein